MAIKVEFGKCDQCDENNPRQLKVCRKCGAPLPWAKAPKPQISKTSAPKARAASSTSTIDWGFWGVAAISFFIPLIGILLFFGYSRNSDDKATAAIGGFLLAIVLIVLRIAMRLLMPSPA
jgi:ribosomal protein L40E